MARLFDDAQNEYFEYAGAVVSAAPFTVAVWARPDSNANNHTVFCIGNSAISDNHYLLYLRDAPDDDLRVITFNDVIQGAANTTNTYTVNNWHHCILIEATVGDRRTVILDGDFANKGTDFNNVLSLTLNRTTIGARVEERYDLFASGRIAWPAVWSAVLTDAELASLAAGAYPPTIRPASLVSFWPLGGFDTNETDGGTARDIWGGFDLTAFSNATGPGIADHPGGLIYPASPLIFPAAVVAAVGNRRRRMILLRAGA